MTVSAGGARLDRLLDESHARLVGAVVAFVRARGWDARVEVTFSEFGERGSIDVLGWHPIFRALAVIEVKSEFGGIDPLLRPLDIKVRLAPAIAARQFGWQGPVSIGRIVVVADDRSARRVAERHEVILSQALPSRSRDVRRWLGQPAGAMSGLWFLTDVGLADLKRNPSSVQRVRATAARSQRGAGRGAPAP